jgi:hypothetical protein
VSRNSTAQRDVTSFGQGLGAPALSRRVQAWNRTL